MNKINLLFVLGTRPEAIKCAPVILACQQEKHFRVRVLTTSQHRELQDQVLREFGIDADFDLDLMQKNSDLARLIGEAWAGLCKHFDVDMPNVVLVQGDTSTAFIAALAAQYHRIPVAHIEAGLRTHDKSMPFPEEINRRLIGSIADLHFAPTVQARENLLKENVSLNQIYLVGNSGIDALLHIVKQQENIDVSTRFSQLDSTKKLILVTCHRRENWGEPIRRVCQALKNVALDCPGVQILFLCHPNPQVIDTVREELSNIPQVIVRGSVPYPDMALLLNAAYLIVTDSGGIQEEAPVLGKPVLVLRDKTERMEGVDRSSAVLVGTDALRIKEEIEAMLQNPLYYQEHAKPSSPYGDGGASERICQALLHYFGMGAAPKDFDPTV